ncbi:MAG: ATP-binding protein, partial [Sulfolobales archaeon]
YGYVIDILAPDIIHNIKLGMVNVVNISQLDEEAMDAVISHYLRRILDARKENKWRGGGLRYPVLVVIEEAHVFLSRDRNTLTKYWASRISREGRKFGVGLIIVSQRPKGLDENILSQMTNKIILKIIEPSDKKYILEASDNLSEDLVEQLSSLDIGEAIVIGKIVNIPAIVKIDKFEGKLSGSDPDLMKEWREAKEQKEIADLIAEMGELKF